MLLFGTWRSEAVVWADVWTKCVFFHQMWSSDGSSELAGAFPSDLKGAWGALHPSQRGLKSPGAPLWTPMWKRGIKGLQREAVLSYLTAADFLPTQIWQFNGARHMLPPATKLPKIQQEPEVGGRQGSQRKPRLFREPCRAGRGLKTINQHLCHPSRSSESQFELSIFPPAQSGLFCPQLQSLGITQYLVIIRVVWTISCM